MFDRIQPSSPDPILTLMRQAREDTAARKIDLTIGVYFDDSGNTPIMRAVKTAEQRRTDNESTKTYLGLDGDSTFSAMMRDLTLDGCVPSERVAMLQTPGGSGAICIVSELVRSLSPNATVWASNPGYFNHYTAFNGAQMAFREYPYLSASQGLDFAGMMDTLNTQAKAGDIVIVHACCHNPSGVNLSLPQWQEVTNLVLAKGLVPFIDIAYQGLGQGWDLDAAGLRLLCGQVPEAFVAYSCSKNFGLYRERTGGLLMITETQKQAQTALGAMHLIARRLYSMPPHHGAALVKTILTDPELAEDWRAELESYRVRVSQIRQSLCTSLRRYTNTQDFDFLAQQSGMFSLLPLRADQVDQLRDHYSLYLVPVGKGYARINVAACPLNRTDDVAEAIAKVTQAQAQTNT